ncbi:membrane-associated tyrosine- and threonine-specific cdc2-inhibitory kinase [Aplochiton taeniatus]
MSVSLKPKVSTTPLTLPAHFSQAEQSFSLKRRRLPFSSSYTSTSTLSPPAHLSHSLPPRPPSKGCPPLSRVFPQRPPSPWTPLSRSLIKTPPPASLFDPIKQNSYFSQCFTNLGLLGRGSFGEVYKVLSHQDGRHYAVKRSAQRFRGNGERNRSVREARNHERLCPHPYILGFVAAWEEGGRLYIQTELCCTSLLLHAEAQPPIPDEPAAWDYLCDLLSALHHLHSRGFAHLDIKPANVFLTRSGRLKLGDFGLLLELPLHGPGVAEVKGREKEDIQEGDPRYMAPELLKGEYGHAADVFSLGISILELACNMEVPKGGEGWQQLRHGHLPSEFTNALSTELQTVLKMMLVPEPSERATVPQLTSLPSVVRHRWRRRAHLLLCETMLALVTLCQSVVTSCWGILSSLHVPFLSGDRAQVPCTPPKDSWGRDFTLPSGLMHTDSVSPEEDTVFLPDALGPELSPTFSNRVKSRLSLGSTSTPLPRSPIRPSPTRTPTQSRLPNTPQHCFTQTPSSIHFNESCHTATPSVSPIGADRLSGTDHSLDTHSRLSISIHSSLPSDHNWLQAEPVLRASFEPKNLLTLFDETLEGQP